LLTFSAHLFYLSAAENAPLASGCPDGGAFYAADKRKKRAKAANKRITICCIVSMATVEDKVLNQLPLYTEQVTDIRMKHKM